MSLMRFHNFFQYGDFDDLKASWLSYNGEEKKCSSLSLYLSSLSTSPSIPLCKPRKILFLYMKFLF